MGWLDSFFSNPVGAVTDALDTVVSAVTDPFERGDIKAKDVATAAALATGGVYLGSLGEAAGLAEVTSAGTSAGLFPDLAAGEIAATTASALPAVTEAAGGPSFTDYLKTGSSVVNLGSAGLKLAGVAQLNERLKMTNTTPNAQNLVAQNLDIAPTPSGLTGAPVVATTPTGPVMAPTAQAGMMDQKSMMILLGAGVALYFLWQYKKGA